MATVLSPPEQRILLENISWQTYESLLQAHRDRSAPRFTYDQGHLELMSPSAEHEELKDTIALLVNTVAEELNINTRSFGSATFRREDLGRGFEPDACFYVQSVARISGKTAPDLTIDPPPDLVVEIDITSPSLSKFPILAQLGVTEVWRSDGSHLQMFHLLDGQYVEGEESVVFPKLTSTIVNRFLAESRALERLDWLRQVRAWARAQSTT